MTDLPHVAGLITNLADDLALVERVRDALIGEQQRRQQILRDAGNVDSLREYQLRQAAGGLDTNGRPLEPLPYLLVIVDEFGELLSSQPDFINVFVQIGRVGRSLGIHLLLATQRLEEGRLRGPNRTCPTGSACAPSAPWRAARSSALPTPTGCRTCPDRPT
jgi:DNA segregation ATPase FtsK/SpoIIIE, S-DNA-T family